MGIINDNFMLNNKTGYRLYHNYAKNLPVIDYHCHLDAKLIAEDYRFKNAGELFLGGDHYKWRFMRSNGIDEKYITGDASFYDKFMKWAEVIPYGIGNPLFHWQQLELKKYFDIDEILTKNNAEEIWNKCNEYLAKEEYSAKGLIKMSGVEVVCTTDDPADSLCYHKAIKESGFKTKVLPTFRPDKVVDIDKPTFIPYIKNIGVKSLAELENWLVERVNHFEANGCVLSDHSLSVVPYAEGNPESVFNKVINGENITTEEADSYKTHILCLCAREYTKRNWTMQIHIGALRNNNSRMFEKTGPDSGFDSMDDLPIAQNISKLLNAFCKENSLPKTILYNLNPVHNAVLASMMGNFQEGPVSGKIQFGSGWWFNDQKEGMRKQLTDLGLLGSLSKFVGMLTDSRSFVSYPRHDYFRRILCNLIGEWVEAGEYPDDDNLLAPIIKGICYNNAKEYFGF